MSETQYSVEMFKPYVGETFAAKLAGESLPLVLKEVGPLPAVEGMVQFSTIFHGPRSQFLRQQIYDLRHPALGTLTLFLVPVGEDAEGFVYQAVFSHMTASKAP